MEQQPHTEPTTPSRVSPPAGAIVAGIGGLLTLVGVFLHWARLTSTLEGGQFAGQQFGPASQSVGATGISHWTGILALVAGLVAVAAAIAIVVLQDPGTRRMAAMAAAGGGTLALLMAILGIVMSESIALGDVPGGKQALDFARQFAEQLGVEGFGIDTGPAMGVFVTAMGGALAAGGGFMALRGGPVVVGRAQEPPPAGTGFEAPSRPPGPQPTVPPEPPSATGPGGPSQAGGETTPEPPPGDAKKSGETTA
jgi:uncharacterized membrane protein